MREGLNSVELTSGNHDIDSVLETTLTALASDPDSPTSATRAIRYLRRPLDNLNASLHHC